MVTRTRHDGGHFVVRHVSQDTVGFNRERPRLRATPRVPAASETETRKLGRERRLTREGRLRFSDT